MEVRKMEIRNVFLIVAFATLSGCGTSNLQVKENENLSSGISIPNSSLSTEPEKVRQPVGDESERRSIVSDLMISIPIEELARRANYILYGKITGVTGKVEQVDDKIQMPISTVTLSIIENWKGRRNKEIEIGTDTVPAEPYYYLAWGYNKGTRGGYSSGAVVNYLDNAKELLPGELLIAKATGGDFSAGFTINYTKSIEELDYTNNCVGVDGLVVGCQ